jgi:Putative adhesin
MTDFRGLLLPLLLLGFVSAPVFSQPEDLEPGFEVERSEHLATVPVGTLVELHNGFGDVRVRFGGYEGVVELRAVIQQFETEGARLEVESRAEGDTLRLRVGERSAPEAELLTSRRAGQRKRADLVLFLPQGVNLSLTTTFGEVEMRGLKSQVTARSESGTIHARKVSGDLELSTLDGAIVVNLEDLGRLTPQKFTSERGDITLYLQERSHFSCRVVTQGLLSTDFSLTVEPSGEGSGKVGLAKLGKGTTPVAVTSREGDVRLVLKPAATEARVRGGAP